VPQRDLARRTRHPPVGPAGAVHAEPDVACRDGCGAEDGGGGRRRVHARRRGTGVVRDGGVLRAGRAGARGRQLLREVGDLPGRRGPRRTVERGAAAGDHRGPPPGLGGAPARMGVSRPGAGGPGDRADRYAAPAAGHPRRRGRGGRRGGDRGPVRGRGAAVADAARHAVHRRRAHRRRGPVGLRGLGALGSARRRAGHSRRLPRSRRRRPGAVPDLPAGTSLRRVHRRPPGGLVAHPGANRRRHRLTARDDPRLGGPDGPAQRCRG
jgi:hypothetical protein